MAANYVLLASETVGAAGASSVTFSNIPQTGYTDLKIVTSSRSAAADTSDGLYIKFNTSASSFTMKRLYGSGTAVVSNSTPTNIVTLDDASLNTASVFANNEIYIPNYASANYKSYSADSVQEQNGTASYQQMVGGLWSSTAAITSINLYYGSSSNIAQYSSFYLYGIAASGVTPVIAPFATGGNVTNDGTYWIHTFLASGTFTPFKTLSCDYLVVAGGGGGGGPDADSGGGGGAGGLRCTVTATGGGGSLETALSLTAQAYTVTIGAGGAASLGSDSYSGNNSVFSTVTSTYGGRGGSFGATYTAAVGGSGGGGGANTQNGAAGTANQGYAGGNGQSSATVLATGGGGGASAVGAGGNSTTKVSGNGGAGVATSITGSSVTYAGGGGGGYGTESPHPAGTSGTGGAGGGGNGGNKSSVAPTAGTVNSGGGGGGGSWGGGTYYTGESGGSGIVIVRYAMV